MPSKQVKKNVQHTSFEYEANCHQNLKRTIIPCILFPSPCQNKGTNLYFRMLCGSLDGSGVRGKIDHVFVWLSPFAVYLKLSQHR